MGSTYKRKRQSANSKKIVFKKNKETDNIVITNNDYGIEILSDEQKQRIKKIKGHVLKIFPAHSLGGKEEKSRTVEISLDSLLNFRDNLMLHPELKNNELSKILLAKVKKIGHGTLIKHSRKRGVSIKKLNTISYTIKYKKAKEKGQNEEEGTPLDTGPERK